MSESELSFSEIRQYCVQREVDLVLAPAHSPFVLSLRGQFDGHGHFFSILTQDVEYIDLANGVTVGELMLTSDVRTVAALCAKWKHLAGLFSGTALVIRSADFDDMASAAPSGLHVVIANSFFFAPGPDWKRL